MGGTDAVRLARWRTITPFDDGQRELRGGAVPALLAPLVRRVSSVVCAYTCEPVLALSYDDGPDPEQTPALLDLLAERQVQATFFLLTERARRHPDIVRRMVTEGHEVGLHGIDHTRLSTLTTSEARRRLKRGVAELSEITGRPVRHYRPAYGAQTLPQALTVRSLGLLPTMWSGWASDWEDTPVETAVGRAVAAVHPGCLLLLHDSQGDPDPGVTVPYLQRDLTEALLDRLSADAYRVVSLADLLSRPQLHSVWFERSQRPA